MGVHPAQFPQSLCPRLREGAFDERARPCNVCYRTDTWPTWSYSGCGVGCVFNSPLIPWEAILTTRSEFSNHDHPMITLTIPNGDTRAAGNRDGALVDVHITNVLPCVSSAHDSLRHRSHFVMIGYPGRRSHHQLVGSRWSQVDIFRKDWDTQARKEHHHTFLLCKYTNSVSSSNSPHLCTLVCNPWNILIP